MKKTIFATALLIALSTAAFAAEKNVDKKLLNDLTTALRNLPEGKWTDKAEYSQVTFNFNSKIAAAYYDPNNNELLGFGIRFTQPDLPQFISDAIKKKYSDWLIADAMAFIDNNGYVNYFVQARKDKANVALKITTDGQVSIYSKMLDE
jgi:hypothetical protein